jgi:hypothetical protein
LIFASQLEACPDTCFHAILAMQEAAALIVGLVFAAESA